MSGPIHNPTEWAELTHAYGTAADVPDMLERAGSDDPMVVERALYDLAGTIFHQGWVYPATVPAVAALYNLVSKPDTHHRPQFLQLLSDIAGALWDLETHDEAEYDEPDHATILEWARAARAAVQEGVPTLMRLLDDEDPAVRAAVPFVLADFPDHDPDLVPLLLKTADIERDAGAAASMVLAVGDICCDRDDPPLAWLKARKADTRREVRAAAAVAVLWSDEDALDDDLLDAVTAEVRATESALDDQPWVLDNGRIGFLMNALDRHPVQIRLAYHALTAPDAGMRPHAVFRAAEVMRTWRAAPAELLPALADLLTTEVVRDAVWEIKKAGPDIALIADHLLALLDHSDDLVAGSALESLARAGDARCLQSLTADLADPHLSFDPSAALSGMKEHADALLDPVREFLRNPKKGTGFAGNYLTNVLSALTTWADRALPLLPDLISLLERRKSIPATANALAALGPAAAEAVPALRRHLGRKHGQQASHSAAWAIWHITGDSEEPLRYLTRPLRTGQDDTTIQHLFDLGPAAAPALPLIDQTTPQASVLTQRATGDTTRLLPHLVDAVSPTLTGMLAMCCLADIGPAAAPAIPHIREIADSPRILATGPEVIATDRTYQRTATEALARITQA